MIRSQHTQAPENKLGHGTHLQIPEKSTNLSYFKPTLQKTRKISEFPCRRSRDSAAPPSLDPKLSTERPRDAGGRFNAAALNISGNFHS